MTEWPNQGEPTGLGDSAGVRSPAELELMREAGHIVREVLDALERAAAPGVSTAELDALAHRETLRRRARPAFKGYLGFPGSLCASVNDEVVHGIPSKARVLAAGDLLKLDFGVCFKGWYGDGARTVPVGRVSDEAMRLVNVTREALSKGLAAARGGARVGDIGFAVQSFVEAHGCSVVRDLTGHGIGKKLHEEPRVPNYGAAGTGPLLRPGMTLAIEPMVNLGTHKVVELDDEWTLVTMDHRLSAHFEHTVAITLGEPEILTG